MDPTIATEALGALAESAAALRAGLEAVPTGGRRRQRDKSQRLRAYLRFQEAALAASVWPGWFGVVEQAILAKRVATGAVAGTTPGRRDHDRRDFGRLAQQQATDHGAIRRRQIKSAALQVTVMKQVVTATEIDKRVPPVRRHLLYQPGSLLVRPSATLGNAADPGGLSSVNEPLP